MSVTYRIGAHYSVGGSLEQAARDAHQAGANTMQIFTASPRMWRASRPGAEDVKRFRAARMELDIAPLVVHGNYLVNLASIDETIRGKSIQAFREELLRCIMVAQTTWFCIPVTTRIRRPRPASPPWRWESWRRPRGGRRAI